MAEQYHPRPAAEVPHALPVHQLSGRDPSAGEADALRRPEQQRHRRHAGTQGTGLDQHRGSHAQAAKHLGRQGDVAQLGQAQHPPAAA